MSTQEFIGFAQLNIIKIVHINNSVRLSFRVSAVVFLLEIIGILHRDLIRIQGLAGPAPQGIGLGGGELGHLLCLLHGPALRAAFHSCCLLIITIVVYGGWPPL